MELILCCVTHGQLQQYQKWVLLLAGSLESPVSRVWLLLLENLVSDRLWGCLVLTRGKQGNLGHCPILQWLWGAGRGLCVTPRAGSVLLARLAVLQHPQLCLELQCGAPSFPAGAGFGWSCMPWHAAELCSSARVRDSAVPPGEGQREEKDPLGWVPSELWLQ